MLGHHDFRNIMFFKVADDVLQERQIQNRHHRLGGVVGEGS